MKEYTPFDAKEVSDLALTLLQEEHVAAKEKKLRQEEGELLTKWSAQVQEYFQKSCVDADLASAVQES